MDARDCGGVGTVSMVFRNRRARAKSLSRTASSYSRHSRVVALEKRDRRGSAGAVRIGDGNRACFRTLKEGSGGIAEGEDDVKEGKAIRERRANSNR